MAHGQNLFLTMLEVLHGDIIFLKDNIIFLFITKFYEFFYIEIKEFRKNIESVT